MPLALLAAALVVLVAVAPSPAPPPVTDLPPWPSPEAAGLDAAAVKRLVEAARATEAAGLVIVKDGRVVVDERSGPDEPLQTASVTKSFTGLAIGLLVDEGKLKSLDQPVSDLFPEWRQGRKRQVTIRHLLNQTSGLQNAPSTAAELEEAPDLVQMALAAELGAAPGERWAYNNKAVGLLSGVVEKASGQRLDLYLRDRLFAPLGIADTKWVLDPAGHAIGFSGLQLRPRDLARVGELLAAGDEWRGKRILSRSWIEASVMAPSQPLQADYGLLWWLVGGAETFGPLIDDRALATLRKARAPPEIIAKAAKLKGVVPNSLMDGVQRIEAVFGPGGMETWFREVRARGVPSARRNDGPTVAYAAKGDLGQILWVSRSAGLVVTCMHAPTERLEAEPEFAQVMEFPALTSLAAALLPAGPPQARTSER